MKAKHETSRFANASDFLVEDSDDSSYRAATYQYGRGRMLDLSAETQRGEARSPDSKERSHAVCATVRLRSRRFCISDSELRFVILLHAILRTITQIAESEH